MPTSPTFSQSSCPEQAQSTVAGGRTQASRGSRRLTASLAVAIAATFASGGCGKPSHTPGSDTTRAAAAVRLVPVETREVAGVFEAGGTVQAQTTATLASRIMATVREVRVRPGDRVTAGQVLALLDDRDLSAAVRQARTAREAADEGLRAAEAEVEGARAALALARATHDRVASLRERNSATASELDQAVAGLRGAESRLASAEARLRQARAAQASAAAATDLASATASFAAIAAPFAGVVTEKFVEPGNLVSPGMPLLRLEDTSAFRVDVRVDESRAAYVKVGDTVPVHLDRDPGATTTSVVEGTVKEVARAVDADTRAFLVKVALPEADVRSGMFGRVQLPGPRRQALLVPATAIVRRGQVATVFVADGSTARLRIVHTGTAVGPDVVVVSGLSEGERVVAEPPPGLADGHPLTVGGNAPAGGTR